MDHSHNHYFHTRNFCHASASKFTMATATSMVVDNTDWYTGYNGFSLSCYWLHNRSGFGSERSGVPLQCGDSSASVDFLAREVAMEPVARHRNHLSGRFSRQIITFER